MKRKTLFLKWAVVNVVSTAVVVVTLFLASSRLSDMNVITWVMAGVIGLVYAITTIYAGAVAWGSDTIIESGNSSAALRIVRHSSEHIAFAANVCPYIGLLGAVTGIFVTLSAKLGDVSDADHLKNAIAASISGMGIAFIPTVVGIYACLVLIIEHHIVKHAIDKPTSSTWI